MPEKPMDAEELCTIVGILVKDAEDYRSERSVERIKAMEYFDGDSKDMQKHIPADEGKSRVVSRDVRSVIKKLLPSVYRTLTRGEKIVEYQPVGEGDEAMAEQATEYVNNVALKECSGRRAIKDAINDAVRLRNGILKWHQEKVIDVKVSLHTGLDEDSFAALVNDDDVDVLEHSERTEQIDTPKGAVDIPVHDVKIRRRITTSMPKIAAIPLENWLIHPDAIRLEDSPVLGENTKLRRSDLVKMGYEKDKVWGLPTNGHSLEQEAEEDRRRRDVEGNETAPQKALDEIDFYDLLVRVDYDGDGIAELRRMVFGGGLKEENLLENTEWDEINYADIVSERRPHQWEGNSVADDVVEIQTINTVLLRQTLDNLYWQNNLQPIVQDGQIVNPESVTNPSFGLPIRVSQGVDVRTAVGYNIVPLVADKSFAMIEYMKNEATDRTGISDASSGMAPDALQNMTAKASAMIEQAGIGQTELTVEEIAESLVPAFKGFLKLIIQHQDKPRTIRLRKKWVTYDPRTWNSNMDAEVNVGLGAGTRERDMMAVGLVMDRQERLLTAMGPAIGMLYVSPENLSNSLTKFVESAGLKTPSLYFSQPTNDEVQQAIQSQSQQPSPEQVKAQTALQVEDKRTEREVIKTQVQTAAKREEAQMKAEVDINREREQRDADLQVNLAELDRETEARRQEMIAAATARQDDAQLERERMALDYRMHAEDLASRENVAEQNAQASIQKAQAASIGKQFATNDKRAGK